MSLKCTSRLFHIWRIDLLTLSHFYSLTTSGAGKTTLLDVLADRKSIGVISGDRLVNGRPVDQSFQRGCGYAEQQDLHEPTATVREAMRFSAYLRQPASVSKEEKDAWVEECISLLEMEDIAQSMIGWEVFGLGVGDRKRATIGEYLSNISV